MRRSVIAAYCFIASVPLLTAASVGSGAQSPLIQQSFQNAFARGQFSLLVVLPPLGDVRLLGSPGLVQEFQSKANSALKFALVKPNPSAPPSPNDTLQVYSDIYAFYSATAILNAAGYPTNDTTPCPSNKFGACDFQLFTNNYAVFAYSTPFAVTFPVADPFYTEWNRNGGIGGVLGIATGASTAVTSAAQTAGTQQLFLNGAVFSYSAGAATPATYTVSGAIYAAFSSAGGYASLGFPLTEEMVLANGLHRQVFESARIEWTPGATTTVPAVLFPVAEVDIAGASAGLNLSVGATATLTALVFDTHGNIATGRTLAWATSNGSVVSVQSNGATAVVQGVGPGAASVYVTGEGKTSAPLTVRVGSSCCGIGEGAPTQAITQAFQAAAARNHLAVTLPNPTGVTQVGAGYVQTVGVAGSVYVIAESAKSAIAYVAGGSLYAAYLANGGFTGPLGFPSSDASAGGTQFFESGAALAGSPVQIVPVPITAKWLQSGAETGPLGMPSANASTFMSLSGIAGNSQTFANGVIYGIASGAHAGQAFILSGLILARYLALSGPAGTLGIPVSDSFLNGAVQVQNFAAGYIDLQPGAAAAVEHFNPRNPAVSAAPATVGPGGRVHIGISGFAFGATLAVSITGQAGFPVTVPGGEFGWDIVIPANAKPGPIAIQARAADSGDAATGQYTVASLPQLQPTLTALSGDRQTGLPGSVLAAPLIAVLRDLNGNPLPGVPVSYAASPGGSAQVPNSTDANGQIAAAFRLPPAGGVAALAISAAGRVVNFSALATASSLQNFPSFTQVDAGGGLTAALAAAIRYYQNQGVIGSPNGLATPPGLAQFLTAHGGYSASETGAQVANPWIAMLFAGVGGGISIEAASLDHVRDLINTGSPVPLALSLQQDGAAAGGAAVDAIGVNADGSIAISDPNPAYGRVSLNDYLTGFTAQGHTIQATLSAVFRIAPASATGIGFVIATQIGAAASANSPAGPCPSLDLSGVRFIGCDGTQAAYQLGFSLQKGAVILDLAGGPVVQQQGTQQQIGANSGPAFQITRVAGALLIGAQTTAVTSVVNAAGFAPGLSPGGLFTIFGTGFTTGLSTPVVTPVVTVSGQTALVLAAFPFQINAQMPTDIIPGSVGLQIDGELGPATQEVSISAAAPGIFLIGGGSQGAILNQDGTINAVSNPARRGEYITIYCTGLGATAAQGSLQTATIPVAVVLNGADLKPSFTGLTPGIAGLYQVNVQLPANIPPGTSTIVLAEEASPDSNSVLLAVE